MTIASGILGNVNGISCVRRWLVSDKNDVVQYAASCTRSAIDAIAGNTDWNAFYAAFGHTPATAPGSTFTFTGTVDGTNGLTATGMVDVIRVDWPIYEGAPITYIVGFSPGTAMATQAAAITDTSTALPPTAIGCKVQVANDAATPSYADMTGEEKEVHLTISRDNRPTPTGRTGGLKSRIAGHWKGEVEFTAFAAKPSDLPQKGQTIALRIFVNSTQYWDVKWWEIDEKTDDVKIEGTDNYQCKIHAVFRARAGGGIGFIKTPAGTQWWPAT